MAAKPGSQRLGLIAFGAAAIAALALSFAAYLWVEYRAQVASASALNEQLVFALDEHVHALFEIVDNALLDAADQLKANQLKEVRPAESQAASTSAILAGIVERNKRARALAVLDETGRLTSFSLESGPGTRDLSDREYFTAQRDNPNLGVYIGVPAVSRANGDWVIPLSRRLPTADGSFAGVIQASIALHTFEDFLHSLQIGPNGVVGIARLDGPILARQPETEAVGYSLAKSPLLTRYVPQAGSGTYQSKTVVDGVERIVSYRTLRAFGVVVYVSRAVNDMLAAWYGDLRTLFSIWLICALVIAVLTVHMVRQVMQRETAEAALGRSENRFRGLIEQSTDIISVIGPDGTVVYRSPSSAEILGFRPEDVVGHSLMDRIHPEDASRFAREFDRIKAEPGTRAAGCLRVRHKDDTWHDIDWSARNALAVTGIEGIVINSRDVTARRRAEAALVEAKIAAEAASRAKSAFLARMSHELRTPLNAVIGFAQLLHRDRTLSARQTEYSEYIVHGGEHLLSIVNDILDLGSLGREPAHPAIETVGLRELFGYVDATMRPVAEKAQVALDITLPEEISDVSADPTGLRRVLMHLVSNAISYNRPGGTVVLTALSAPDGLVRVTVMDTGLGIDVDRQAGLFEPFGQVDSEYVARSGLGVGLALSRRLIEGMGGAIGFNSEVGRGSTFWIELKASKKGLPSPILVRHQAG
jgi:two-component system, sensor histidine kinase and response regulator